MAMKLLNEVEPPNDILDEPEPSNNVLDAAESSESILDKSYSDCLMRKSDSLRSDGRPDAEQNNSAKALKAELLNCDRGDDIDPSKDLAANNSQDASKCATSRHSSWRIKKQKTIGSDKPLTRRQRKKLEQQELLKESKRVREESTIILQLDKEHNDNQKETHNMASHMVSQHSSPRAASKTLPKLDIKTKEGNTVMLLKCDEPAKLKPLESTEPTRPTGITDIADEPKTETPKAKDNVTDEELGNQYALQTLSKDEERNVVDPSENFKAPISSKSAKPITKPEFSKNAKQSNFLENDWSSAPLRPLSEHLLKEVAMHATLEGLAESDIMVATGESIIGKALSWTENASKSLLEDEPLTPIDNAEPIGLKIISASDIINEAIDYTLSNSDISNSFFRADQNYVLDGNDLEVLEKSESTEPISASALCKLIDPEVSNDFSLEIAEECLKKGDEELEILRKNFHSCIKRTRELAVTE